jgi:phytoene desaturase
MSEIIVVGAGLAGLSAACHLIGRGHDVLVVERESQAGGRAGREVTEGFVFDTGPSVLTMPQLIADTLSAVGVELADVLTLRRLDPAYRAVYADGSTVRVRADHADMRAEIAGASGMLDAAAYDEFAGWLRQLYDAEMSHFIDRNFSTPLDLVSSPRAAARLLRLGAFGRLGPAIRRRFADPRLHRLFSFQALYAGLSPDDALALYAVITYMDTVEGVWYPDGGMHAVPAALAMACEKAGGRIRYSTDVSEILRRADTGAVAGIRLADGEKVRADAVVLTPDLPVAYRRLLPELNPPRAVRRGTYSPSAVVWHLGVRGVVGSDIAHHNIHFGGEWSAAFDALLRQGRLMPDPSRLVTVPSRTDTGAAPPGCSSMFVLEPVPNLAAGIDWTVESGPMRERLLTFLSDAGYPTDIVVEQLVTPLEWERQGLYLGTPFSLAHTFRQTGPFRPPNVEKRVPGTFFAGSGTGPGVGIPMVLISGKLAADRVDRYLGEVER